MGNFPVEFAYLLVLLITITIVFVCYKRPIYEAMLVSYLVMIAVTGKYDKFMEFLVKPAESALFYAIVAFLVLAYIFGTTKVVDDIINVILSVVGRFRGGAGYVALGASTFMAALSGTGPGNVAAVGVFTIPAMIRTGFPRHFAATVEMSCSTLGPMIPPSGTILLAFATLDVLYPGQYAFSAFWMAVWGVGLWFIFQRWLTIYVLCRYYKVQPVPPDQIPKFIDALKAGWKALLIPVIIFLPLYLDFKFGGSFLVARLGKAGAKAISDSVILFTPGVAAVYTLWIARKQIPGGSSFANIFKLFQNGGKGIVPVSATIYFAYSIAFLFGDIKVGPALGKFITAMGFNFWEMSIFLPLFFAFLGMMLPGSSQIVIFGTGAVAAAAAVGINPLLAAALLPAITSALEGMTPPFALCMYAAMAIAKSGFVETCKLTSVWVGIHAIVAIVLMMGLLPILFM